MCKSVDACHLQDLDNLVEFCCKTLCSAPENMFNAWAQKMLRWIHPSLHLDIHKFKTEYQCWLFILFKCKITQLFTGSAICGLKEANLKVNLASIGGLENAPIHTARDAEMHNTELVHGIITPPQAPHCLHHCRAFTVRIFFLKTQKC